MILTFNFFGIYYLVTFLACLSSMKRVKAAHNGFPGRFPSWHCHDQDLLGFSRAAAGQVPLDNILGRLWMWKKGVNIVVLRDEKKYLNAVDDNILSRIQAYERESMLKQFRLYHFENWISPIILILKWGTGRNREQTEQFSPTFINSSFIDT